MSPLCSEGHESRTGDYCDQCGRPIGEPMLATPRAPADPHEDEDTSPATRHEPCPVCAADRSSDDRFCEACGHDFESTGNGSGRGWELVASASRDQFERYSGGAVDFPAEFPERRFRVDGPRVRIGCSRGSEESKPEIDLAGSPEDPGISRLHAALERQDDGCYSIRDLGSTNGTTLNDDPQPLRADVSVPVGDGDRIRIGAWTTITLVAR